MAGPDEPDPIARLWLQALRTEVDALVLRFEAQLKQHVAATADVLQREKGALAARVSMLEAQLADASAQRSALQAQLADATRQVQAAADAQRRLEAGREQQAAAQRATIAALEGQLRALGERVESLDEQFAGERTVVEALLRVRDTALGEAATQVLGQPVEATPACLGALKARGLEPFLIQVTRERGRAAGRSAPGPAELEALRALAEAAGCRLLEVPRGTRFVSSSMDKAGERSSPAEEGEVLECVMPGLRRADAQGSLLFPRVVVATG